MNKDKDLHIRMKENDFNYLKQLCKIHSCTQTELITELIRRGTYTQLNYETLKNFNRIFGNIGNNINQIAKVLNIIKNTQTMSEEQYQKLIEIYNSMKSEYMKHQLYSDKLLRKIYRLKLDKKKYNNDFLENDSSNINNN